MTFSLFVLMSAIVFTDINHWRDFNTDLIFEWQKNYPGLKAPMRVFSFLGDTEFYVALGPLLLWGVSYRVGTRFVFLVSLQLFANGFLKTLVHDTRPAWYDERVAGLVCETEYGWPSGHSQSTCMVFGYLLWEVYYYFRSLRNRLWWRCFLGVVSVVGVFFIGFSRAYNGAHFLYQVISGWLLGWSIFFGFLLSLEHMGLPRVEGSLSSFFGKWVLILLTMWAVTMVPTLITNATFTPPAEWIAINLDKCPEKPFDPDGGMHLMCIAISVSSTLAITVELLRHWHLEFDSSTGVWWKRTLRIVLAMLVCAVVYFIMGKVVPRDLSWGSKLILRYWLRFTLLGFVGVNLWYPFSYVGLLTVTRDRKYEGTVFYSPMTSPVQRSRAFSRDVNL